MTTPEACGLRVIGVGAARTGTLSLTKALNMMNLKTYHMRQSLISSDGKSDAGFWLKLLRGEVSDPVTALRDFFCLVVVMLLWVIQYRTRASLSRCCSHFQRLFVC